MSDLMRLAERIKLARSLDVPLERVAFLAGVNVLDVRALRDAISARVFGDSRGKFQRIAEATKLVPATISATLSEKVFGPLVSACVSGLLQPDRAVAIAGKLHTGFLADLSMQMDPRAARAVLERMPVELIVKVGRELLRRNEFVTMARFIDCITDEAIHAFVDDTRDDEPLVLISNYVESVPRLDQVIQFLPPARIRSMVAAAIRGGTELRRAGVALLNLVSAPVKGVLADAAAAQGNGLLRELLVNLRAEEQDQTIAVMVAHMNKDAGARARALLAA